VSTDVLEESMTDTATDADCSQNTEISAEYLAQLRELAESQGWSLDGTVRRALAVTRAVIRHPEV
jgi:ABC-type branched-subunit amino acid transport system ATPase component